MVIKLSGNMHPTKHRTPPKWKALPLASSSVIPVTSGLLLNFSWKRRLQAKKRTLPKLIKLKYYFTMGRIHQRVLWLFLESSKLEGACCRPFGPGPDERTLNFLRVATTPVKCSLLPGLSVRDQILCLRFLVETCLLAATWYSDPRVFENSTKSKGNI